VSTRWARAVAEAARGLVDLFLPSLCPLCGRSPPETGSHPLCPACAGRVRAPSEPWCPVCAVPFPGTGPSHPCPRCLADPPPFRRLRARALYEGAAADLIQAMKFSGRLEVRSALVDLAIQAALEHYADTRYAAVVPVPAAPAALRSRGFDLPGILSRGLARHLGVPWRPHALSKDPGAPELLGRGAAARLRIAARAYRPAEPLAGPVLLVDDVATTTATARACARACREAGAHRVDVLVLARTPTAGSSLPGAGGPGIAEIAKDPAGHGGPG